jgi:hypothetical protein
VFILLIFSLLITGIPVDVMLYLIVLPLCISCVNGHFYIFLPKWSLKAFVHFKLGLFVSLLLELKGNFICSAYCTLIKQVLCNYRPYAATFFPFSFFFAWKRLILTSSNTFIFPYYSWFVVHIEEYNAKSSFMRIYQFGFSPKYTIDFLLSIL